MGQVGLARYPGHPAAQKEATTRAVDPHLPEPGRGVRRR